MINTRSRWLTGTSGSETAPGACPARADGGVRTAVTSSNQMEKVSFTSKARVHVHRRERRVGVGRSGRGFLVGRRRGREWLANRQPHRRDLLVLHHDDFLREAPELLVAPVTQLSLRHVDRTLMMRNHRRDEVSVHVAGGLHVHGGHHLRHGSVVFGQEQCLHTRGVRIRATDQHHRTQRRPRREKRVSEAMHRGSSMTVLPYVARSSLTGSISWAKRMSFWPLSKLTAKSSR